MSKTSFKEKILYPLAKNLWDAWCLFSIVGIWPRFIEPNLLEIKNIDLNIGPKSPDLEGFKILQFSDLHLRPHTSDRFLKKMIRKAEKLKPDMIVFVGDFICYSHLQEADRLKEFLCSFSAPYGCYCSFGNHDYNQYVSINQNGEFDVLQKDNIPLIIKGFKRLFAKKEIQGVITERALAVNVNKELCSLLENTPFRYLNNESVKVQVDGSSLNVCGIGDYWTGHFIPQLAFEKYDSSVPGIVLSHNPDTILKLQDFPGDLILCGHTHGGQVNLPFMWRKFIGIKNKEFKKGLIRHGKKLMYVSKGVGATIPFRWFAKPEYTLITLRNHQT